ncbi:malic enzyme-like NAD(P)-binding protein [Shigella flexneri]
MLWRTNSTPSRSATTLISSGIGLGVIASGASRITDEMLMSASETLAGHSPLVNNGEGLVLPELKDIHKAPALSPLPLANGAAARRRGENLCRRVAAGD